MLGAGNIKNQPEMILLDLFPGKSVFLWRTNDKAAEHRCDTTSDDLALLGATVTCRIRTCITQGTTLYFSDIFSYKLIDFVLGVFFENVFSPKGAQKNSPNEVYGWGV